MNKNELVEAVKGNLRSNGRYASHAAVAEVIDYAMDEIMEAVAAGDRVILAGFGVFQPRSRAPRAARNPHTGERVQIKAKTVPYFKSGTEFKRRVAQ